MTEVTSRKSPENNAWKKVDMYIVQGNVLCKLSKEERKKLIHHHKKIKRQLDISEKSQDQ